MKENSNNMKNICTLGVLSSLVLLTGCATMFTGNRQNLEIRTYNETVGTKLDNVAKFEVITDKNRVHADDVKAGEVMSVRRCSAPVVVRVKESECIMPTTERFAAGMHPAFMLNVVATSLLSSSIDSSTGAAWRYDETMFVTPKVKDTPECKDWLEKEIANTNSYVESKPYMSTSTRLGNSTTDAFDEISELHPKGYSDTYDVLTELRPKENKSSKGKEEDNTVNQTYGDTRPY